MKSIFQKMNNKIDSLNIDELIKTTPIYILAIAVYLQHAWVPGFFQDGYLYAAFSKNAAELGNWLVSHLSFANYNEFTQHSPFFFIMMGLFFKIFKASYLTARIFGVLFTIVTLITVINWSKKLKGFKAAFLSGTVFVLIYPLIKKSRFPNMDLPLMLFILSSMVFYYKAVCEQKRWGWPICGMFFGLALLTKGPMAVFIPLAILIHLIFSKRVKLLVAFLPWFSFVLGFIIFSIWPISLYLSGKFYIFEEYLKSIFVYSIAGNRGVTDYSFFSCTMFLFKRCLPWMILTVLALYQYIKNKSERDDFSLLLFSLFFAVLLPVSIVKFKYSHYLIPLYPAMAIISGITLSRLGERFFKYYSYIFKKLSVVAILILLIFPFTTNIRRDKEIFKTNEILDMLKIKVDTWGVINSVYPYYSLVNMMAFESHDEVLNLTSDNLKEWLDGQDLTDKVVMEKKLDMPSRKFIFLISASDISEIEKDRPRLFSEKLQKLIFFKGKNMFALIPKISYKNFKLLILK